MISVRPLARASDAEVDLVASRMRLTLAEVLGEQGEAMYSLDWLRARVRWHFDPQECQGEAFVAEDASGEVVGHSIVRVDPQDGEAPSGLFATTYVVPEARRQGVALALLERGERWLRDQGMQTLATATSERNTGLIRLFESRGYRVTLRVPETGMVRLTKALGGP